MRAVILAGGLGTRLRPYTTVIPKPLVPVGDRPVLEHIMRSLYAHGVRTVDLCVGHLGELIRLYLSQLPLARDMSLAFHWEESPLGTAGALRRVPGLTDTFIVMNGDILTTLSYRELVEFHRERDAALTIAVRRTRVDVDLGVVEARGGFVTGYREKPSLQYEVSMGIYVYDERALAYLPPGPCQFPDLVLRLVDAGERVAAYRADDADWFDIGTLEEHERAAQEFERAPMKFEMPASAAPTGSAPRA